MTDRTLRDTAMAAVEAYDRANPMRTADWHGEDCDCFRCEMDRLRALLDAHTAEQTRADAMSEMIYADGQAGLMGQPAPDAVAEAGHVMLTADQAHQVWVVLCAARICAGTWITKAQLEIGLKKLDAALAIIKGPSA